MFLLNVRNSPSNVLRERNIGKVLGGKLGKNENYFFLWDLDWTITSVGSVSHE